MPDRRKVFLSYGEPDEAFTRPTCHVPRCYMHDACAQYGIPVQAESHLQILIASLLIVRHRGRR